MQGNTFPPYPYYILKVDKLLSKFILGWCNIMRRCYNCSWNHLGYVEGSNFYDSDGNLAGFYDGNTIYDRYGYRLGYYDDNRFYNNNGGYSGYLNGNVVYGTNNNAVGFVDTTFDFLLALALLFLFL